MGAPKIAVLRGGRQFTFQENLLYIDDAKFLTFSAPDEAVVKKIVSLLNKARLRLLIRQDDYVIQIKEEI